MKKIILVLAIVLMAGIAHADYWEVVASWTHSAGPNHDNTDATLDGQPIANCQNILPTAPAQCTFNVAQLTGQVFAVKACNANDICSGELSSPLLSVPAVPTTLQFQFNLKQGDMPQ